MYTLMNQKEAIPSIVSFFFYRSPFRYYIMYKNEWQKKQERGNKCRMLLFVECKYGVNKSSKMGYNYSCIPCKVLSKSHFFDII